MISREHRCIFIHIPKTAGTSVEKLLGHFEELQRGAQDHRTLREIERLTLGDSLTVLRREGPLQLAREVRGVLRYRDRLSKQELGEYFKFAFVRNPWARVHSWYRNVMRDEVHLANRGIPPDCSLYRFLTEFGWQTELRSQLDWIVGRDGELGVDFVGRFETLSDDVGEIARRLGLDAGELPNLIPSAPSDYRADYDERTRAFVATRYAEEIERFDYRFED